MLSGSSPSGPALHNAAVARLKNAYWITDSCNTNRRPKRPAATDTTPPTVAPFPHRSNARSTPQNAAKRSD